MSWSAKAKLTNRRDTGANLVMEATYPQQGNGAEESKVAIRGAQDAVLSVAKSGCIGFGEFTVSMNGHSNDGNVPQEGFGNDYINISISQVVAFNVDPVDTPDTCQVIDMTVPETVPATVEVATADGGTATLPDNPPDTEQGSAPAADPVVVQPGDVSDGRETATDTVSENPGAPAAPSGPTETAQCEEKATVTDAATGEFIGGDKPDAVPASPAAPETQATPPAGESVAPAAEASQSDPVASGAGDQAPADASTQANTSESGTPPADSKAAE